MSPIQTEIYFTTGDFAKLCEVTKQTLFHYDNIGLLCPDHKDSKGYRYYSYTQFDTMYVIESLKEMEMSLSEIKVFISNTTPDTMIDLFKEKSNQLSEKINNLISIQKTIEKKIQITEQAKTADFSKIKLVQAEEEYLYLSAPLLNYDDDENRASISYFYKECMRTLHEKYSIGVILEKHELLSGEHHSFKHLFAKTDFTDALPLVKKDATLQVVGYHIGKHENIADTYNEMMHFIESEKLEMTDFSYEEPLMDRISVNDSNQYVTKITIPVKKLK
ncbi:Multidrug-efflux transporter 1 regulator [Jeotgalicoccus aerolatus]|uniref:DNA-binding transcriptional MerR regulator n=1 Tax=Jeotgalicoccus aerolatus TaxID=709510 RepID=A0ABS4HJT3_9STAP|nr:MerR family transcriptional regulator [Jeotgalicoccus aerolatus]MBP1950989.1 DNA-binding transcriptional MerR regulator [Jeotgalicoccus aerolatus]NMA81704.1 MerR family transcriptional regulator [Jeotgalicoccus aerolatus]CAD2078612.1 Multidrug-efflux transporter 1 regulator [Jeotgalicoccus aerolatus]GGE01039.1 multidrug-efflux transporter 2 regulator [Jeotgalicoccus aerolatus]HJG33029.1 MerR family transcriptional regulator [Jeotgalicoccus aerolatus]